MINIKRETPKSLLDRCMSMFVLKEDVSVEEIQSINPKFVMQVTEEVEVDSKIVAQDLLVVDYEYALFEAPNEVLAHLINTLYTAYIIPRLAIKVPVDGTVEAKSESPEPELSIEERANKIGLHIVK